MTAQQVCRSTPDQVKHAFISLLSGCEACASAGVSAVAANPAVVAALTTLLHACARADGNWALRHGAPLNTARVDEEIFERFMTDCNIHVRGVCTSKQGAPKTCALCAGTSMVLQSERVQGVHPKVALYAQDQALTLDTRAHIHHQKVD